MEYHYSKKSGLPFDETIAKVTEALQKEGFGVLTNIDLKATFKKKLDVDFRNYQILGACNPNFAYQALSIEPTLGVMLPCNIAVQETENKEVIISAINPMETMAKTIKNEKLTEVAENVSTRLKKAIDTFS
ncbi:MAG: DUF302 domain-containing protein [Cyclobacteriaceae bacterium]|nr:DUF302 domain-containing protein [Cyclobacteriaceae bacterium]